MICVGVQIIGTGRKEGRHWIYHLAISDQHGLIRVRPVESLSGEKPIGRGIVCAPSIARLLDVLPPHTMPKTKPPCTPPKTERKPYDRSFSETLSSTSSPRKKVYDKALLVALVLRVRPTAWIYSADNLIVGQSGLATYRPASRQNPDPYVAYG